MVYNPSPLAGPQQHPSQSPQHQQAQSPHSSHTHLHHFSPLSSSRPATGALAQSLQQQRQMMMHHELPASATAQQQQHHQAPQAQQPQAQFPRSLLRGYPPSPVQQNSSHAYAAGTGAPTAGTQTPPEENVYPRSYPY
jgi:hypothetical protein